MEKGGSDRGELLPVMEMEPVPPESFLLTHALVSHVSQSDLLVIVSVSPLRTPGFAMALLASGRVLS